MYKRQDVTGDKLTTLPASVANIPALALKCCMKKPEGGWTEDAITNWKTLIGKVDGGLFYMSITDKSEEGVLIVDLMSLPVEEGSETAISVHNLLGMLEHCQQLECRSSTVLPFPIDLKVGSRHHVSYAEHQSNPTPSSLLVLYGETESEICLLYTSPSPRD